MLGVGGVDVAADLRRDLYDKPSRRTWRLPAWTVGLIAAGLVVDRLVIGGDNPLRWVYAEDSVFLSDAMRHGWSAYWSTLGGYGHFAPRTLALVGSWLPLGWYAAWTKVAATAVSATCAAFITAAACNRGAGEPWALTAGLALVLAPALQWEGLAAIANLQTFLVPTAAWALLVTGSLRRGAAAVAAITALSSVLIAVPLAVTAALRPRATLRNPVAWTTAGGLVVQAVLILWAPTERGDWLSRNTGDVTFDALWRRGLNGITGPATLDLSVSIGAVTAALVLAVICLARLRDAATLAVSGVVLYVGASIYTGGAMTRYQLLAAFMLAGATALSASALRLRALRVLTAAALALVALLGFPTGYGFYFDEPPPWSVQVRDYQASCDATGHGAVQPFPAHKFPRIGLPC